MIWYIILHTFIPSHSYSTFISGHSPRFLSISSSLVSSVGKTFLGCRAENRTRTCLTTRPAHYQLSYAAPYSELRRTLTELCRTLTELRRILTALRRTLTELHRTLNNFEFSAATTSNTTLSLYYNLHANLCRASFSRRITARSKQNCGGSAFPSTTLFKTQSSHPFSCQVIDW